MTRPAFRRPSGQRAPRTLADKRAAFLQVLVWHRTLDGQGFETAKRTSGLKPAEIEQMVAAERQRRAARESAHG